MMSPAPPGRAKLLLSRVPAVARQEARPPVQNVARGTSPQPGYHQKASKAWVRSSHSALSRSCRSGFLARRRRPAWVRSSRFRRHRWVRLSRFPGPRWVRSSRFAGPRWVRSSHLASRSIRACHRQRTTDQAIQTTDNQPVPSRGVASAVSRASVPDPGRKTGRSDAGAPFPDCRQTPVGRQPGSRCSEWAGLKGKDETSAR
jgi:hypothetical protein